MKFSQAVERWRRTRIEWARTELRQRQHVYDHLPTCAAELKTPPRPGCTRMGFGCAGAGRSPAPT